MRANRSDARVMSAQLLLVFTGGTVGVFLRELLLVVLPAHSGLITPILMANTFGSFLLGVLLERLSATARSSSRVEQISLFVGTGVLGGFTTYSALSQETMEILVRGEVITALAYSLLSLLFGLLAAALGMFAGSLKGRKVRQSPRSTSCS